MSSDLDLHDVSSPLLSMKPVSQRISACFGTVSSGKLILNSSAQTLPPLYHPCYLILGHLVFKHSFEYILPTQNTCSLMVDCLDMF